MNMPIPLPVQRRIAVYNYLVYRVGWLVRQPHEAFVSFLCAISGPPLIWRQVNASSLEAVLSPWLVTLWGVVLTVGSLCTFYGLIKAERRAIRRIRTGFGMLYKSEMLSQAAIPYRRIEYYGLTLLMWAGLIYVAAILITLGFTAAPALGIILAFAATSGMRAFVVHVEIDLFKLGIGVREPQ